MRLSEFWQLMDDEFGHSYARSVTMDQQLSGLGSRTASAALADGEDPGVVWRSLCEAMDVPPERRFGVDPGATNRGTAVSRSHRNSGSRRR